jgi:hypothetical protein
MRGNNDTDPPSIEQSNMMWNNEHDSSTPYGGSISPIDKNPLFVDNSTLLGTSLGYNIDDNFYLAQEPGDVSRRPLRIMGTLSDRSEGDDADGIYSSESWGFIKVFAKLFCGAPVETPNASGEVELLGSYDAGGYVQQATDSIIDSEAPILLWVQVNRDMPVGRSVTLNFDNGSGMEVYLPELECGSGTADYLLWVAEDGSTYWARNVSGDYEGDEVTQDALYAMRYDPDGLARGRSCAAGRYGSKRLPPVRT